MYSNNPSVYLNCLELVDYNSATPLICIALLYCSFIYFLQIQGSHFHSIALIVGVCKHSLLLFCFPILCTLLLIFVVCIHWLSTSYACQIHTNNFTLLLQFLKRSLFRKYSPKRHKVHQVRLSYEFACQYLPLCITLNILSKIGSLTKLL